MRWSIGAVKITRVLEMPPVSADPARFIQAGRQEILDRRDWLCPHFADEDGNITLHFQAFVVESGGVRIMVDPCIGNDKQRSVASLSMLDGPFLERLAAAGYPRENIDYVLCTHLHADHCGWNTMLVDGRWVPTFPNAQYLFAKAEYEYLRGDERGDAPAILADSVKPVIDAGLATFVEPDHVIVEEVRLEPAPGHTPGHCFLVIASEGQEAVITGDALHHPVQVALPQIADNFCWDKELAEATRRRLLKWVSDRGALLLGSHFSGPVGVFLTPDGDAWKAESLTAGR
ncbi:MBL fold metallo-hydrolase [Amycolatopsis sp. RM579]|uniref:MBL fold metallo-hydrolase n=1 Tax=Amycolatopsis pithecellobii TaxID=664692 RepID=A0A6N7YMQ5_9PSEU|nr:MBL fold metallo-hydrolase [Amycolatopsis pithecellobii]